MDLTRIELSEEFRDRILELRDRHLVDKEIDWRALFDTFGTHYPYAVTYGGMAWMETGVTKDQFEEGGGLEVNVKAEAEGTFEELFSIGGKIGGRYAQSGKDSDERSSEESVFGTYGGSFARGGGWSLGRGEEVPQLLDLRPLYELLSPVFFDDPIIFGPFRTEMVAAFEAFERDLTEVIGQAQWASSIRLDIEEDRP